MNELLDDFNETPPTTSEERMWATFAHLGFLAGLVVPLGNIIAPLVIWLVYKDQSDFIDRHGKEALNFHLSMLLYGIGLLVLSVILFVTIIGILLIPVVVIVGLVVVFLQVIASIIGGMTSKRSPTTP